MLDIIENNWCYNRLFDVSSIWYVEIHDLRNTVLSDATIEQNPASEKNSVAYHER